MNKSQQRTGQGKKFGESSKDRGGSREDKQR